MEKVLKKYTRIPPELYVERNADLQLKSIVEEMQRPGYVLVARQMGKTNLLFNAKRTLENENRLFAYSDLSNLYEFERDCYRHIIDNVIEPNLTIFEDVQEEIDNIRNKNLPPHREYSQSLRIILEHFKGNVVIILDEIDALKSVEYSDHIFAQIRSNYFSQTNFPEFERLTYILSGVIEPTELIKDKNKSPFNIGEKIYLDDFTKSEHNEFIQKSRLNISPEISNEVFNWACGNPRLTFDICSEIESFLINNSDITIAQLEEIIRTKYLTSFDIAPIDHIREVVKSNKQIRSSINSIRKKESHLISDEVKRRLYLYGIINSKFDEETRIKNKIIDISLSEEWVKSVERLSKDDFNYGLEKIESGEYNEAIKILHEFLLNSEPTVAQKERSFYNIGYAHYKLGELEQATEFFSKDYTIPLFVKNSKTFLGVCYLSISRIEDGKKILEDIIELRTNDFAYRFAVLNLTQLLSEKDSERTLKLYDELIQSTYEAKDQITLEDLNQIRALALFNQTDIYLRRKQDTIALDKIDEALKFANDSDSLYLMYIKYTIEKNKGEQTKNEIVNKIVNNNLLYDTKNSYPISFNQNHLFHYLGLVFDSADLTLFNKLLDYAIEKLHDNWDKNDLIYVSSISSKKRITILNYLLSIEPNLRDELLIEVYHDIASHYLNNSSIFLEYFEKYLNVFKRLDRITGEDLYLFGVAIKTYSDQRKLHQALQLCDIIDERLASNDNEQIRYESTVIYYWYANLYLGIKNNEKADSFANKALSLIESSKGTKLSIIDEEGVRVVTNQLNQIKLSATTTKPYIKPKQPERNDRVKVRYQDGKTVEGKYKKFEADILSNRCIIV